MKTEDRLRARQLRADHGLPMKEIARRLGVSVSSVSLWVRNPRYNSQRRGHGGRRESSRRVRATAQQRGREMARLGDPLHRSGCMLHWAEGSKSRNVARITNSDPDLLRLYRYFLPDCYGVSDGRIA